MTDRFATLRCNQISYWLVLGVLVSLMVVGYVAAHTMESEGHWISGMNNQVVWGLPHVFAVFLILSASGALNVASMSSAFGKKQYTPWVRFSGLLSIALLVGGLLVLVLDLGRPERLIVAMTHFNFTSIFAWNIFLYTGFVVLVVGYLYTLFERSLHRQVQRVGFFALCWRLILTSGTGSIFGFLVARQLYDTSVMIPLFIVLSLILGTAIFTLVSVVFRIWQSAEVEVDLLQSLNKLLGIFIGAGLLLTVAFHLTKLYTAEHYAIEGFILSKGGMYTVLFWSGQLLLGTAIPLAIIFLTNWGKTINGMVVSSLLAVVGGLSELYVIIIGGQVAPQMLFPGKTVSSTFYDGVVTTYTPSGYELALSLGGIATALILLMLGTRILPFLPDNTQQSSTG